VPKGVGYGKSQKSGKKGKGKGKGKAFGGKKAGAFKKGGRK